ncbi:helix-turn-helix domain-containing protein [Enterobacter ludwigii]|jgi:CRP-like cAMP-binding protein|nr:helix-turn-helix domain-containing protein [Enterobacter ludwigii]
MKPEYHIKKLIDAISQPDNIKKGRIRQITPINYHGEKICFILHEGSVGIYRGRDQLLISHTHAPILLGMNFLAEANVDFILQARTPIRYEVIPVSHVKEIIERENLWEDAAYYYMFTIKRLMSAHNNSAGLSTYELIRLNLAALMDEDDSIRLSVSASDYIQEKTNLSRSRVMKILSDLKTGGYIDTHRGVLINIKSLPDKY